MTCESSSGRVNRPRRWIGGLLFTLTVVLMTSAVAAPAIAQPAAPIDGGPVRLVDPDDPSHELTHGDESTAFSLQIPDGAHCPGDSMHDQWRVQTFMVPAADDLGSLSYGVIGPDSTNQFALFGADVSARSFANVLTQANAAAGLPGVIAPFAPLSFAVVAAEQIPSGAYQVGFACTYLGATATYWHSEVVIEQTSGELAWRLSSAPPIEASPDDGGLALPIAAVALAAVAIAVAAFVVVRRTRSAHISPKDPT